MISGYEKFRIPDEMKVNDFSMEVNYTDDSRVKDCKMLRFTFPDGRQAFVKRECLHALLFAIGNKQEQRNLIPQKLQEIRNYETILGITATKEIAKGEKINVHVKIPIPVGGQEVIGSLKVKQDNSKFLG